jgi:hypothetical protein
MAAKTEHFQVGCGDMTLITLDSGKTLQIDCNIRAAADDPDDDTADVASQLKDRLKTDAEGRRYVDAMMLSHPDEDHIRGFAKHFHVGPLADYVKGSGKIIVREMWSSPLVFKRASKHHTLCPDAKAWAKEARRRVQKFRDDGVLGLGDKILVMGEDVDGKTDDLGPILVKGDQTWTAIDGVEEPNFEGLLLAPIKADSDEVEETLTKNNSSIIARFKIGVGNTADACRILAGGDAEVAIWEKLWARHKDHKDRLSYDLLITPHHCSWHSLSYDSWSKKGEDAKLCQDARDALGQARKGAKFVASSKTITDDDSDPPCIRAKREYDAMAKDVSGKFYCLADGGPEPLEFTIEAGGLKEKAAKVAASVSAPALIGSKTVGHG